MKYKKLIFCLFFLSLFIFAYPASAGEVFSVTQPTKDQICKIGEVTIAWDPPFGVDHVKIELYKSHVRIKTIDMYVDNTGIFIWNITANDNYPNGDDYQIKIESILNPGDTFGWSREFCIYMYGKPADPGGVPPANLIVSIIFFTLIIIIILIYYDKKTDKISHGCRNLISKIKSRVRKIKRRRKRKTARKEMEQP